MRQWNWTALFGLGLFAVVVLWCPSNDRLQALATYAWPTAVVVCCMLFHAPLSRLFDRVQEFGKDGVKCNQSGGGAPVVKAADAPAEAPGGSIGFSAPARKLLGSLGFYQLKHFPGQDQTHRWWMVVPPGSPDWAEFARGAGELLNAKLIVVAPPSGTTFLTEEGLVYYRQHQAELDKEPRYENFGPAT